MPITAKSVTAEQAAWLKTYEDATGFEPLHQDELDDGEISFVDLARNNIRWFEAFANDAMLRIDQVPGRLEAMDGERRSN